MMFSRWRVSARIWLLVSLTLVGLLALCVTALFLLKGNMLEDRKQKTRNLVETSVGMLASFEAQARAGRMTEAAAKEAARESLRQVRYGGDNYYFILDRDHKYVLYPSKPEFEGQDKSDLKDANGKHLIRELVSAAVAGGGFVDYWFPKAGQQVAEPKLSYAAPGPWGWVVGTGIYIDDIDTEYRQTALVLGGISGVLLLALCAVGFMVAQSVLRQLGGEPVLAAEIMHRVAEGDLTASVGTPPQGSLLYALGEMLQSLRVLVNEINQEAGDLLSDAAQLNQAASSVSEAATSQADATAAVAAVTEQLTVSSQHIAENAQDTERESLATMTLAGEGNQKVVQASVAMQDISNAVSGAAGRIRALEEQATNVSAMATVIKEIAGQTNLLALNAAIEAARAGELGRGFAVVADEVRKLAERASNSTSEIEQMIGAIQGDTSEAVRAMQDVLPAVEQGVRLAAEAAESLRAIETGASRSLERVRDVADATREQGSASTSIAQRMEHIAQMTEETTATLRGTVDTSNHLEGIATNLKRQIERFKTR